MCSESGYVASAKRSFLVDKNATQNGMAFSQLKYNETVRAHAHQKGRPLSGHFPPMLSCNISDSLRKDAINLPGGVTSPAQALKGR
jgi:hypothetical protein